ncbi:hypothetical protein J2855_004014 [Agrobacterium tumefaciens]|jgi:hypothetical protein|uniref:Uncharacterized protein n=1 Tax=Agrobacterium radiobacter TaxID=362 RepID=A0ABR6JC06_AGRRD|nr:hypothetical protein [Agrobacterium radiobacter]MBP2510361.1 hypothetical protein [Agrobacterium tumefaciens]MCP2137952.1 hypothetical protein [Rhizobium sp. SLBN-94]MBB4337312.1 hypothetical protein [Agrobacterium radiobacter]MBB4409332.1 hypothetical protein [Agrobacterium radiobacter]
MRLVGWTAWAVLFKRGNQGGLGPPGNPLARQTQTRVFKRIAIIVDRTA